MNSFVLSKECPDTSLNIYKSINKLTNQNFIVEITKKRMYNILEFYICFLVT